VNGTVTTSEWYTSRVDGGSDEVKLEIEEDWVVGFLICPS
jgi:hypothetical protein